MKNQWIEYCDECHTDCTGKCKMFEALPYETPTILQGAEFVVLCLKCMNRYDPRRA